MKNIPIGTDVAENRNGSHDPSPAMTPPQAKRLVASKPVDSIGGVDIRLFREDGGEYIQPVAPAIGAGAESVAGTSYVIGDVRGQVNGRVLGVLDTPPDLGFDINLEEDAVIALNWTPGVAFLQTASSPAGPWSLRPWIPVPFIEATATLGPGHFFRLIWDFRE